MVSSDLVNGEELADGQSVTAHQAANPAAKRATKPEAKQGAAMGAPDATAAIAARPLSFGPSGARLFGWYHAGAAPHRSTGVVLCAPIGAEGISAYGTYTELAERLAAEGFPVLRFDYHGTGDSSGRDEDPARVSAWRDSVLAAVETVRRLAGVQDVALFGVRFGATLAAEAAAVAGGATGSSSPSIASLVLWAPCVTGRQFARELRASGLLKGSSGDTAAAERGVQGVEAFGFLYTEATLAQMSGLDLRKLERRPASRALLIARDDLPGDGGLVSSFRTLGVTVEYRELAGYAAMMQEPHNSVVPDALLDEIVVWLAEQHPTRAAPPEARRSPVALAGDDDNELREGGVREVPIFFGEQQNLFGIVAEPNERPVDGTASGGVAVLMLNVGTNHRVGPNRMYVKMARAWAERGFASLRFDLAGIGDSRAADEFSETKLYSKQSVHDVRRAMDALARQRGYDRFVLMGLCSGAYVAFQTALADSRVAGQVLLNPRRLVWKEGDTLQSAMQRTFKSTHFYRQALRDPATWRRLLRGQLDVRGVAGRVATLAMARARRTVSGLLGVGPSEDDVLLHMRQLSRRGTRTLILVGTEDDGLDYLEYHLGAKGQKMRHEPNFAMQFIHGTDHTFTQVKTQDDLAEMVRVYLAGLGGRGAATP